MSRPREFDVELARDQALRLFWRKGYGATALPQLVAAMGISRSSLYAAFGDKRGLFVSCLDLFAERTLQMLANARAKREPLDALQAFLERHLRGKPRQDAGLGCLLVNTVLEMAGVDDGLSAHASHHLSRIEQQFDATLRDAGCAPAQAHELAQMLMLLNEGVRVASRRSLSVQAQLGPIETAFCLLRGQLQAAPAHRS